LISHRRWTVSALAGLLLFGACGGGRKPPWDLADGPHAAVYRARFESGPAERARKFRLLVYATEPDRLHAEILSAVGTTELILDAGGGRVSVFFVREKTAFVGPADAELLDALLGVPVKVEDFVQALLGNPPLAWQDWTLAPTGRPYPDTIRLEDGDRSFELRLKRIRPIRADPTTLGTGRPPPGAQQRPLEDLDPETIPGIETEGEAPS
jgi:hypothetical protein